MPTTPNMGMVLPTDHSDADIWGSILNTALTLNDLHDHTTGKGVPVPSAALKINADVSWSFAGTNYAITALKAIDFTPVTAASMTSYASALFTNSSDANNLYFRNEGGTNVKITDGNTLNVSIVGGIGGDYSSIGALLDYDDATDTYRLRQETAASVRQFAKVAHADIKLFEYDPSGDASVPANAVTIKSPDALAAGYDTTFFAALPAATSTVQISSAGQLTAGEVDRVLTLSAAAFIGNGSGSIMNLLSGPVRQSFGGAGSISMAIPLREGDRIKSVTFARFGDGVADINVIEVRKTTAAGSDSTIGTGSVTNPSAAWADTTIDVTDTTLAAGETITLYIEVNAANIAIANVRVTYDRP